MLLFHRSNHGGVLNSAGLAVFDITADTPTPTLESSLVKTAATSPLDSSSTPRGFRRHGDAQPSEERLMNGIAATLDEYASYGFTTAHEGGTSTVDLRSLQRAAAAGFSRSTSTRYHCS